MNFYEGGVRVSRVAEPPVLPRVHSIVPADQGIYLDTTFFREMETRMGAKGDFAKAYVIAHEVGHHIQNLSGIADQVRNQQQRV